MLNRTKNRKIFNDKERRNIDFITFCFSYFSLNFLILMLDLASALRVTVRYFKNVKIQN